MSCFVMRRRDPPGCGPLRPPRRSSVRLHLCHGPSIAFRSIRAAACRSAGGTLFRAYCALARVRASRVGGAYRVPDCAHPRDAGAGHTSPVRFFEDFFEPAPARQEAAPDAASCCPVLALSCRSQVLSSNFPKIRNTIRISISVPTPLSKYTSARRHHLIGNGPDFQALGRRGSVPKGPQPGKRRILCRADSSRNAIGRLSILTPDDRSRILVI